MQNEDKLIQVTNEISEKLDALQTIANNLSPSKKENLIRLIDRIGQALVDMQYVIGPDGGRGDA